MYVRAMQWAACWVVCLSAVTTLAERPAAPDLLPHDTLAYVRVRDAKELVERFQGTALGRMSQEEKIRPLIAQLYGSAAEAFTQIEEEVGVSLDKILELPQGEIVFGLVAPPRGRPVLVTIIDVGTAQMAAEKLIERGEAELAEDGATRSTETYRETEMVVHSFEGDRDPLLYFFKDDAIVITSSGDVARQILDVWAGETPQTAAAEKEGEGEAKPEEWKSLAKNLKFAAAMKRCGGPKDDPAQATMFVDPISLFRVSTRGNFSAQAGLAFLPALGLDGFEAVAASITFATGDFDMVTHLHVLLEEPRSGVLEMLALDSGDTSPEPWVPKDVASYSTANWNVPQTYSTLEKLVDSFQGEGRFAADAKRNVSDRIGVDLQSELIPAMAGRFTYLTWMERPARIGSEAALIGIKLTNPDEFQPTFDKLTEKYAEQLEKKSYGGTTYWMIKYPELGELPDDATDRQRRRREQRATFRTMRPSPCFAILGDYLVVTDRVSMLEKVINTKSEPDASLANDLEFKLIASKIKRQVGGAKPGMITFNRPEEGMKLLYEMATGDDTRKLLADQAENNGFFKAVDGALRDNPLPPFPVLAQYLAPGGGMLVSDETGFHYTGFVLKRK